MFAIALSGMAGEFRGRRGKDQPSATGIDGGKAKHVPEKGPVGFGVACVDDGMHACNHEHLHRWGNRALSCHCRVHYSVSKVRLWYVLKVLRAQFLEASRRTERDEQREIL